MPRQLELTEEKPGGVWGIGRRENNISNPVDLWMNGNKYDPKRTYALKPDK